MLICPSCRKRFETGRLSCDHCGTELLPPSTLLLHDRYPSVAQEHRSSKIIIEERYVELAHCSLNEAKEIKRLLEPDGISCTIERNEDFHFQYRLEGGSQISDQKSLILKVKATELSKARALLEWEVQQGTEEVTDFDVTEENESLECPACETDLSPEDEDCPECGAALHEESEDPSLDIQDSYRCSACGELCQSDDPLCLSCGARFDH